MLKTDIGSRLPNTLMLESYMREHCRGYGYDRRLAHEAIHRGIQRLEQFAEKYRDGRDYTLLRIDDLDANSVRSTMAGWLEHDIPVEFISRARLLEESAAPLEWQGSVIASDAEHQAAIQRAAAGHERLLNLFELASRRSLRVWMRHLPGCARPGSLTRDGRTFENLVSLALGSQRLLDALDAGFGRSFAHIFKDDVVDYWVCYLGHLMNDPSGAKKFEPLSELMRKTFPVLMTEARMPHPLTGLTETEPRWLMMTD